MNNINWKNVFRKQEKNENLESNFDKAQKRFIDSVKELVPGSTHGYSYSGGEFAWSFSHRKLPGFESLVSIKISYSTNTSDYSPSGERAWKIWFNEDKSGSHGQNVEGASLQEAWNSMLAWPK